MTKTLASTAALIAVLTASPAYAAQMKRVVFESHGERLVGDLYLPDDYEDGDRLPGIVVTGAWTTVKEQMPARYAAELADRGYAALAFDFRGWGQSEGAPRQLEDPERKTQDIVAAAGYLATRAEVDAERIGGLGVCASSGYMTDAATRSDHIRSLALVAPWLHNADIVEATYGGADSVRSLIETGRKAVGDNTMIEAASASNEDALMYQAPYYVAPDRGAIPEYVNRFNLASWEPWLTYDAVRLSADVNANGLPVAIVHSEAAAIPQGAHAFFDALTVPIRSESWLENVTQMDFYDRDEPVRIASDTVAAHFADTLGRDAGASANAQRERTRQAVMQFLTGLERKDMAQVNDVWAENGVQEMPYTPPGIDFPSRVEGREALIAQYAGWPENAGRAVFTDEIAFHDTADPHTVIVEYRGVTEVVPTDRTYDQKYIGVFRVNGDGKIELFREYFDPNVFAEAFGMTPDNQSFTTNTAS